MSDFGPTNPFETLSGRPVSSAAAEPSAAGNSGDTAAAPPPPPAFSPEGSGSPPTPTATATGTQARRHAGSPAKTSAMAGEQEASMDRGVRCNDVCGGRTLRRRRHVPLGNLTGGGPRGRQWLHWG